MSKDTISITATPFTWSSGSDMSTGFTAQEMPQNTVYIDSVDLSSINIGAVSGSSYISDTATITGMDAFDNVTKSEHRELLERVERLEKFMAEEAELRDKYPAVKTAYDEYRLLLVLAKQHTPDILTED